MADHYPERDRIQDVVEAADRAEAIVTEQVRSIMASADARAAALQAAAEEESAAVRRQAHEAACRVLERIESMDDELGALVTILRDEAETIVAESPSNGDPESRKTP